MGGANSGNWYRWDKKPAQDAYIYTTTAKLKKFGLLKPDCMKSGSLNWSRGGEVFSSMGVVIDTLYDMVAVFSYTDSNDKRHKHHIRLATTQPNYGGVRYWFICPRCGKRKGSIHCISHRFACRKCFGLFYESQRAAWYERSLNKAEKIAERYKANGNGIDGYWFNRPKGMHKRKYERICAEMEFYHQQGIRVAAAKFGREWF